MQFGPLCNRQTIQTRFKQMRTQSRQQILAQIYGHNVNKCSEQTIQKQMAQAFSVLLHNYDLQKSHPIVAQIAQIFNINLDSIKQMQPNERTKLLYDKIYNKIQDSVKIIDKMSAASEATIDNDKPALKSSNHFQWLGVKCKYTELRPVFQQILLQKVKLFDKELTQLTEMSSDVAFQILDLPTTARQGLDLTKTQAGLRGKTMSTTIRHRKVQSSIEHEFTNVKIRDKSEFLLSKWSSQQEQQFQSKKSKFKSNLKINSIPVLFQFVKKYTQTVKARDNIYRKMQQRQKLGITPEQLRYLCATSVFLNNSLARSEKQRIKNNIRSVGPQLVSRLELNIAEKIIETYHQLMKRVADLRAKYYEELTMERKLEQKHSVMGEEKRRNVQKKKMFFLKYKNMFERIVNGEKMKIRLNSRVFKWVNLFISKLKAAVNKTVSKGASQAVFKRLTTKTGDQTPLYKLKKKYPSARIIKRQDQYSHRLKYRQYIPSQRFHYQQKFEKSITDLNKTKLNHAHSGMYFKKLTGGPRQQQQYILVDLSKKKVLGSSPVIINKIIKIQAKWKAVFQRKRYLQTIQEVRQQQEEQFQQKVLSLSTIYPSDKKIDMRAVQSRLKRINMKISNIIKPYIRVLRRPINLYTSFCLNKVDNVQLKNKYARNGSIRLGEFAKMVENNQLGLLKKSGIVVTSKEINDYTMRGGTNAMWWAVSNCNLELATLFLQGGGDPNSRDGEENSCLHMAVKNGAVPIIFVLLDYGADLNRKNSKKVTPLYYATKRMLKLLGLEQASVVGGDKDNNALYFKKSNHFENIYNDHCY